MRPVLEQKLWLVIVSSGLVGGVVSDYSMNHVWFDDSGGTIGQPRYDWLLTMICFWVLLGAVWWMTLFPVAVGPNPFSRVRWVSLATVLNVALFLFGCSWFSVGREFLYRPDYLQISGLCAVQPALVAVAVSVVALWPKTPWWAGVALLAAAWRCSDFLTQVSLTWTFTNLPSPYFPAPAILGVLPLLWSLHGVARLRSGWWRLALWSVLCFGWLWAVDTAFTSDDTPWADLLDPKLHTFERLESPRDALRVIWLRVPAAWLGGLMGLLARQLEARAPSASRPA